MKTKISNTLGFTVIEILVVVGILAVLTAIVFATFVQFRKHQALEKDTELIVEVLSQAHAQTLSSQNSSQYGVHFSASQITLFAGNVYSAGASTNQNYSINSLDTILTISLNGGGADVVFNRLSGESSQYGTITVSSPSTSRTKTVTIYKTGVIESR